MSDIRIAAALLELSTAGVVQQQDRTLLDIAGLHVPELYCPIDDVARLEMRQTAAQLLGLVPQREIF